MQVTSLLLLVATTAIATAQSQGIAICMYCILNHAIQSASMDNFVKNLFLNTVTMENGEGYVPEIVSGTLIIQWLLVHDWATVTLVS